MPSARNFFTAEQQQMILHAIAEAESHTSGEVRLHLEDHCSGDPVTRAQYLFHKIGMDKTDERNGVLIYLAVRDRKFAIIGDSGINDRVPEHFWTSIRDAMTNQFKMQAFTEGICAAIQETGVKLKTFFPRAVDDTDELTNEISFRDE